MKLRSSIRPVRTALKLIIKQQFSQRSLASSFCIRSYLSSPWEAAKGKFAASYALCPYERYRSQWEWTRRLCSKQRGESRKRENNDAKVSFVIDPRVGFHFEWEREGRKVNDSLRPREELAFLWSQTILGVLGNLEPFWQLVQSADLASEVEKSNSR